jgi:hypothetical protein
MKKALTLVEDSLGNRGVSFIMMFQLLGVPNLNQRAREVPPFYDSLTTSGVYIVLTKREVYFWIG